MKLILKGEKSTLYLNKTVIQMQSYNNDNNIF